MPAPRVQFRTGDEMLAAGARPDEIRAERDAVWQRMAYLARSGGGHSGERMDASEQREYDALEKILDTLGEAVGGAEVDRRGVVDPRERERHARMLAGIGGRGDGTERFLRPEQRLADWPSNRSDDAGRGGSPDDDEEAPRFGALLRHLMTGRTDGMRPSEIRNTMTEAGGAGAFVPAPTAATFIDRARNAARVVQAGATTVAMDSKTLVVPRLTGSSAPAWRNEAAAIAAGDLTVDGVTLTARSLAFLVRMSWELIEDATTPEIVRVVEEDLAAQVGLELDRVALRGTGTAPEPRGIKNQSGVTLTAFGGANGAAPTNYDHLLDAVQACRAGNFDPNAVIQAPRSETTLGKLKEATTNAYLRPPAALDGIPRLLSNQVPVTLTTGTSTDTSEVYVGEWRHLYLGVRSGPMTIQLKERYADTGEAALIVWFRGDVQAAQPGAFTVVSGIRP
jgi:HK97 family phage major capsid protein